MINIAILGYGVVGSGVVSVLEMNRELINERARHQINLKYVLDIRKFEGDPIQKYITHNFDDILNDPSVQIVVEVMGGVEPAYTFVKKALLNHKNVVTSNKELVAKHGTELLKIAKERNLNFLFEASVGGGIPVIRTIKQALTGDEIIEIEGILNGTTNYILTEMLVEKKEFEEALADAQDKGYAEKDPTADVEGFDACRKLAILLSLTTGKNTSYEDICTEGISKITKADMAFAKRMDCTIKLVAYAKKVRNGFEAVVSPRMLPIENPLSSVNNVFNSILLKGNAVDDVMLYGCGAGKIPTASAVVGDIIDVIRHLGVHIGYFWGEEKLTILSNDEMVTKRFVRIQYNNKEECKQEIERIFNVTDFYEVDGYTDQLAFVTAALKERDLTEKETLLGKSPAVCQVLSNIRM